MTGENMAGTAGSLCGASMLKARGPPDSYGDRVQPMDYKHRECLATPCAPILGTMSSWVIICLQTGTLCLVEQNSKAASM